MYYQSFLFFPGPWEKLRSCNTLQTPKHIPSFPTHNPTHIHFPYTHTNTIHHTKVCSTIIHPNFFACHGQADEKWTAWQNFGNWYDFVEQGWVQCRLSGTWSSCRSWKRFGYYQTIFHYRRTNGQPIILTH